MKAVHYTHPQGFTDKTHTDYFQQLLPLIMESLYSVLDFTRVAREDYTIISIHSIYSKKASRLVFYLYGGEEAGHRVYRCSIQSDKGDGDSLRTAFDTIVADGKKVKKFLKVKGIGSISYQVSFRKSTEQTFREFHKELQEDIGGNIYTFFPWSPPGSYGKVRGQSHYGGKASIRDRLKALRERK